MKLSLKVVYACQVLAQLGATHGKQQLPHIDDLARAEEVPSNYLVQILNELRNGGLIVSKRGKQGGYALSRPPQEISLYDIVRAVEGEVLSFATEGGGMSAPRTAQLWGEVAAALEEKTRQYTVRDLMQGSSETMWYI